MAETGHEADWRREVVISGSLEAKQALEIIRAAHPDRGAKEPGITTGHCDRLEGADGRAGRDHLNAVIATVGADRRNDLMGHVVLELVQQPTAMLD